MTESVADTCIFCRIAAHAIPSKAAHETDTVYAFHDIEPQAPVHILVVPKAHHANIVETPENIVAELLEVAKLLALKHRLHEPGFRLVINTGTEGGQSVAHTHVHILGGRAMKRPPG